MRYGIFATGAGRQSGGPETYEHCLVRSLAEIDRQNEYHIFCMTRAAKESFRLEQENFTYHVLQPNMRWLSTLTSLPLSIWWSGVNLTHATVYAPPIIPHDFVFTMHCFSNFVHPELYPSSIRVPLNHSIINGLRKSRLTVCVSQNVRDHVADTFKIPSDRLSVVYNGVGEEFAPAPRARAHDVMRRKYNIDSPYLLFVGQLKARKNIVRTIEAFHRVRCEWKSDLKLVLAGRRIWTSDGIDEAIQKYNLQNHVVELGHLDLRDLPIIYSGAEVFVFPSLWEGFGIPVIEAMACGVPVVTSNLSCLPEVAGDCAVLVDPYSVDSVSEGILKLLTDSQLRSTLIARGLERARLFTWKRTAQQTLDVYKQAASA